MPLATSTEFAPARRPCAPDRPVRRAPAPARVDPPPTSRLALAAPPGRAAEDRLLLARVRTGDAVAFELVVRRHGPGLLRVARACTRNEALAADVVQETWRAVLRGLPRFEERSSLRTWMHRICVKVALAHVARDRRTPLLDVAELDPSTEDETPGLGSAPQMHEETPETMLLRKELRGQLEAALARIPAAQARVARLRDLQDLDSVEVCERLDISAGNQRVLLHRARARLRKECAELDPAWRTRDLEP